MGPLLKDLGHFCAQIGAGQHRPQQKWIKDMIFGMFSSRSTMLSEIGRALDEDCELLYTEKRLSRNLNSDRLDDEAIIQNHLGITSKSTMKDDGKGVVIAVDYTDLNKPYADLETGMELVCRCRDGSEGQISIGYPVSQLEAYLPDGSQRPVLYRVFSYQETDYRSEFAEHMETIKKAAPFVGPLAWWTFDRGFDNERYFHALSEMGIRWIIRQKLNGRARHVVDVVSGLSIAVTVIADTVARPWKMKLGKKFASVGLCHVLVDGQPCTLVVTDWPGQSEPLALMVGESIEGQDQALEVVRAYIKRWKAEEATRSMKDSHGWGLRLEDLRALTFRGVQRLVTVATLIYSFLAEVRGASEGTLKAKVMGAVKTFSMGRSSKEPQDCRYQLLRGIGTVLSKVVREQYERWRAGSPQNT